MNAQAPGLFGGNEDRVGGPPLMVAQFGGPGATQFVIQPAPLGPPLQAFPPAANLNQQQPNLFGGELTGGLGGAFAGPPPAEPLGAQLRTLQFIGVPPRPGSLVLIGGRMQRPHPIADDSLQLDLIELYQHYPSVRRRRRGFSQGMLISTVLLTVLTLRIMLQFDHLIK